MIAIQHLTKRYNTAAAVDDLTFTVETGEICGLLGPNGAGKSTTMNMITGYLSATGGTASIDGCDIFAQPKAARRKIGYLPEQPPLYLDMTPEEYLRFVAELKGVKRAARTDEVEQALERTGTAEVRSRLIRNLSKGYRQRVGLAGALIGSPEVLILDEPTVGLDPKQIIEMRALIRSLAKNHTVLLSSHIMQEISAVCDKVVILSHGKLVAYDTPQKLSENAEHGGSALRVTALGTAETVRAALAPIGGVRKVEFAACAEKGAVTAVLQLDAGEDARAAVSSALAAAGCAVLGMQTDTLSLEEVFLELTEQADAEAEKELDAAEAGEAEASKQPCAEADAAARAEPAAQNSAAPAVFAANASARDADALAAALAEATETTDIETTAAQTTDKEACTHDGNL